VTDLHTPLRLGHHGIAGVWRHLLPHVEGLPLPTERFAPCNACPQVEAGAFVAACKCCGYLPQVPNYLLGLALQNEATAPLVRAVIAAGNALPQGTDMSPARFRRSVALDSADGYGTDPVMACPFLVDGGCGIYAYRNAVCSTYFCTHDHGDVGEEFWTHLQSLFGAAESAVCQWAMGRAGRAWSDVVDALAHLSDDLDGLSTPDEAWTPAALDAVWGPWRGREEAFYRACADAISAEGDALWAVVQDWPTTEAVAFLTARRAWIPEDQRHEVPEIDDGTVERMSNEDLWTVVQGLSAELEYLPLGERVWLAEGVRWDPPNRKLPLLFGNRHQIHGGNWLFWATDDEIGLLEHFAGGLTLTAAWLASSAVSAVEDGEGFIAQCLRRGLLVVEGSEASPEP